MKKLIFILLFALSLNGYGQGTPQDSVKTANKSVTCKGITKKGEPCKRKTKDISGLCFNHNPAKKGGAQK